MARYGTPRDESGSSPRHHRVALRTRWASVQGARKLLVAGLVLIGSSRAQTVAAAEPVQSAAPTATPSPTMPVSAADEGEPQLAAREHFDRGLRRFNAGENAAALAEFHRAYELVPHPLVLYNLALVHAAMERPVDAVACFDRLLAGPGVSRLTEPQRARAAAERARQIAAIAEVEIVTPVAGARIEVDGVEVARAPLESPLRVGRGSHVFGVVAPGYDPSRRSVTLSGGQRVRLTFELTAQPQALAHLQLESRVPGFHVRVDGQPIGTTPLPVSVALAPGPHVIELSRPGYLTERRSLMLGPGTEGRLTFEPRLDPHASRDVLGRLALASGGEEAVVFIDGYVSPRAGSGWLLPAGPHELRIERAGFLPFQRIVQVAPGGVTQVPVVLEPSAEERARYREAAMTRRTWSWLGIGAGATLAAAGTAFLLYNHGAKQDAEETFAAEEARFESGGECDPATEQAPGCTEALHGALDELVATRDRDIYGVIGLGAGAALLGVGAVLLVTGDDPDRYELRPESDVFGRLQLTPWFTRESLGASVGGALRF